MYAIFIACQLAIMVTNINFLSCVLLTTAVYVVFTQEKCDKTKCKGPIAYYEALSCKPVYKHDGDCCVSKYNCHHLKERSKEKCYVNGKEYDLGEKLKEEDANPCDLGCTCLKGYDGIATFNCAIVDCFHGPVKPGCYFKNSPSDCCSGEESCPENPEDRAICDVNGKEYKDGEYFTIEEEPDKNCICQPKYKSENVEPFCVTPKHPYCSPDFRHASDIHNNCSPVYYSTQSPQTSCSVFSRCQNVNDTVIESQGTTDFSGSEDMICQFGNMTLKLGDELKPATDYSSVCVKCVCEVPPVLTCQRLPDEECDVTNHPPFHSL